MNTIRLDLVHDEDGRRIPLPLRAIPHGRMPPEFDQYRRQNGVYIIVDRDTEIPLYVGESHANRLIHTATRHVQTWHLGPTWEREDVLFAFILCADGPSAHQLQNLIIADFIGAGIELANNLDDRPEELSEEPDHESNYAPF